MSFGSPDSTMPRPIRTLLILNVAVFFIDFLTHGAYLFRWMALDPALITHGHYQYWRVFTYMFVHDYSGIMHILFNMLTLWMFGTPVAQEMGENRFWRFYLLSGLFAGLCSLLFYAVTGNNAVVIGASGAIFALMFAFARFFPTSQILLFFFFPVSAKYAVLVIGAIELLLITSNDHIAHIAHLGGALFAWIYLRWDDARGGAGFLDGFRHCRTRRRWEKARRETERVREVMEDIDPILEKISRSGIQSLTREEKSKLDRVSALKRSQRGDNITSLEDYRSRR
jgi:membrane associated rhomboid family serine protease